MATFNCGKILISGESGWKAYRNSSWYCCHIFLSIAYVMMLNMFTNLPYTSSTVLNRHSKRGHSCLVPDFSGIASISLHLIWYWLLVCSKLILLCLGLGLEYTYVLQNILIGFSLHIAFIFYKYTFYIYLICLFS